MQDGASRERIWYRHKPPTTKTAEATCRDVGAGGEAWVDHRLAHAEGLKLADGLRGAQVATNVHLHRGSASQASIKARGVGEPSASQAVMEGGSRATRCMQPLYPLGKQAASGVDRLA